MSAVLDPRPAFAPAPVRLAPGGGHRAARGDGAGARGRGTGLAVVVGLHVLVGWALASGLAHRVAEAVKRPIEAAIVDETPPPPPPPPPPKIEKIVERPQPKAPPPAWVPPPEVRPAPAPEAPAIVATQAEPPPAPTVVVPPAPAPAPPPAPAVVRQEASLACPGYQAQIAQGLEDAFDRVGIPGVVRTRLIVRGSQVVDATPVSGPKEYYKFVQAAVKRIHCSAGGADEVQVNLDVQFSR